jgi:hypothetical protein
MHNVRFTLRALAVFCFTLTLTALSEAAPRVFVSTSGDDANTCGRNQPCRTFAKAMTVVDAGGEVIALDSGSYAPFTINKAVSVIAAPKAYVGITVTSGIGIVIGAGATDVVLRGLTLNGLGSGQVGINSSGAVLHVETCVVNGFSHTGISVPGASNLFIKDTIVRNSVVGISISPFTGTAMASIDRCRLENNSLRGISVGSNNSGSHTQVTIRDSVTAGNSVGFYTIASNADTTAELNIENCLAANNDIGIYAQGAGMTVRVSNSTVTNNGTGLASSVGGNILTRTPFTNTLEGNNTDGLFTGTYSAK